MQPRRPRFSAGGWPQCGSRRGRNSTGCRVEPSPRVTAAMRSVAETLALDHLFVVCPTPSAYPVDPGITVLPITDVVHLPTRIAAL